jgi:hypothetical protein
VISHPARLERAGVHHFDVQRQSRGMLDQSLLHIVGIAADMCRQLAARGNDLASRERQSRDR